MPHISLTSSRCSSKRGIKRPVSSLTSPIYCWGTLVKRILSHHPRFGQVEVVLIFRDQPPQFVRQVSDLSDLPLLVIGHSLLDSQPEQLVIAQNSQGGL